jgi:hypothetical protein
MYDADEGIRTAYYHDDMVAPGRALAPAYPAGVCKPCEGLLEAGSVENWG